MVNKKQPWVDAQVARLKSRASLTVDGIPIPWPLQAIAFFTLLLVTILVVAYDLPVWLGLTLYWLVFALCVALPLAGLALVIVLVLHGE